jgi:hypothetical protein
MASDSFVYRLGNGDEEGRRGGMEMKDEEAELSSGLMLGVVVEFAARSIPNTHFFLVCDFDHQFLVLSLRC